MPDAVAGVIIDRWLGRVSNRNAHADPNAPVEFENVQTVIPGAMCVRKGMVPVSFANATTASTANIIAAFRYERPEAELIVYQNADGELHAGRGPSV